MKYHLVCFLIAGLFVVSEISLAHGNESHVEESQVVEQPPAAISVVPGSTDDQLIEAQQPEMNASPDGNGQPDQETRDSQYLVEKSSAPPRTDPVWRLGQALEDFTLDDFPTLHPMVVHVPVIMIPLAFLFGIISLFFTNRYLVALSVVFALAGALGGYIAAFPMHPHTRGLSEAAIRTLQQHDFFAYSTLGITASSVVIGVFALLKPGFFSKGLLVVALLLASLCVSVTAHYGGTLTYIHGVGVNGNYLDKH